MTNRIKLVVLITVVVASLFAFGAMAQDPTAEPTVDPALTTVPTDIATVDPALTTVPTDMATLEPTLDATVDATLEPTLEGTLEPTLEVTLEATVDTGTAATATTDPAVTAPTATVEGTEMVAFGSASLVDISGNGVGSAVFTTMEDGKVLVTASFINLPPGFHGFHVHTTGVCDAASGFESAGGHFDREGASHPNHDGDLPSLLVNNDGTAMLTFSTDRFAVADLFDADGSAIVVHSGQDNYANIPARYGADPMAATPDPAMPPMSIADEETLRGGDSGEHLACGVIEEGFMAIVPTVDETGTPADSPDMGATATLDGMATTDPNATVDPNVTLEPTSDLPTVDPALTQTVDPALTQTVDPALTPEPTIDASAVPVDPTATEGTQ
jgi:Cu-Zn family superoxide dismutase